MLRNVLAACLICVGSFAAADGPSYEDTLDFIIGKIATTPSAGISFRLYSPERCVLKTDEIWYDSSGSRTSLYQRVVRLSDLDPTRVEYHSASSDVVHAHTRDNLMTVEDIHQQLDSSVYGDSYRRASNDFFVRVRDPQQNTDRVVRALSHLIRVCGGEEELF